MAKKKTYHDEEGHFTTKENDGGPCHHEGSYSASTLDGERLGSVKAKSPEEAERLAQQRYPGHGDELIVDAFDDDYEEEFEDYHKSYEEVFTDNDTKQIEKYAEHYGVDVDELKDRIHQNALDKIRQGDSVTNAKNDAMEEVLDELVSGSFDNEADEYMEEMQRAADETFDMSDMEPEEQVVGFDESDEAGSPYKELDRQWMKDYIDDNPDRSDKDLMDDIIERFSELSPEDEQYVKGVLKNRKAPKESFADKWNKKVGRSSQMISLVDNAKANGQSPQQVLDSVSYDMDIEPGSEEFKELKDIVMRETNKQGEYNKYNMGSNKLLSGDERKKMQDLSDAFKKAGLYNEMEDGYEDYGANMQWTSLTHDGTWVLNPREWRDYMNGSVSADELVASKKGDNFWGKKFKEGITRKPVEMPKYHWDKGHIVIDEGPDKGSTFDSEDDYRNSVRSESAEKDWKSMSREERRDLSTKAKDLRDKLMDEYYKPGGINEQITKYINQHHKLDNEELYNKMQEHFDEAGALSRLINNAGVGFLGNTMPDEETNEIVKNARKVIGKYRG